MSDIPRRDRAAAERQARFIAEWDQQFAALSPEDQQFVTENPTSLCAEHLTECVEDALQAAALQTV